MGVGIGAGLRGFGMKWKNMELSTWLQGKRTSKDNYYHEDPEVAAKDYGAAHVQAKTIDSNPLRFWRLSCSSGKRAEDCDQVSV